jgi:hypothetical protein
MATLVFTIGNVAPAAVTVSNAKAQEWVQGYILHFSRTPEPVNVPENATQAQTLQAVLNHLARYFRRIAIQAQAKETGRTAEEAALSTGEATDWT